MAIQSGPIFLERTIDDVCFYKMDGKYYVRMKSSLTGKQVKTGKRFRRTMESAGRLARGAKIGSFIYAFLPEGFKQFWMYRAFVGEAVLLIKAGKSDEEATQALLERYATEFMPECREEKEFQVKERGGRVQVTPNWQGRPKGQLVDKNYSFVGNVANYGETEPRQTCDTHILSKVSYSPRSELSRVI